MMLRLPMLKVAVIAAVLLAGGMPARAQERAQDAGERRLLRLLGAGSRASYQGRQAIEMHVRGKQARGSAQVAHLRQATRTEMLGPPRLKGMIIIERGGRRLVRRPGSDRWQAGIGGAPPQPRRMLVNYALAWQGTAEIAGRNAAVLEVRSRASRKLVRKMWVDQETGVVLRSEVYNWSGQLVSSTEFQEIDYTPELDGRVFQLDELERLERPHPRRLSPELSGVPKPSYLPAGFQPAGPPNGVKTKHGVAVHLRYSDGLNTISVFLRKLQEGENAKSPGMLPPMDQPFSAVVQHVQGSYRVTIIGDVDPAELRRMAASIE